MGIVTLLYTFFKGSLVGTDAAGNRYFMERGQRAQGAAPRRWVIHHDSPEASPVPAGWQAWLHFSNPAANSAALRNPTEGHV